MFNILESRNKELARVLKIGQLLGRSLRENVELLSYDASTQLVSFLSESKKVISGKITNGGLNKVEIEDAENYLAEDKFNSKVEAKISTWLGNIYENNYLSAENNFDSILDTWSERSKISKIIKVLEAKQAYLDNSPRILNTKQYKLLEEAKPVLVKFLKENKTKILNVAQVANGVILANTVANAFAVPKLTYEKLAESKAFNLYSENQSSLLFDLIAKQELIRTELLESKRDFEVIWGSNKKVIALANAIHENKEGVASALAEAITEIPYLALVSKKQLTEIFNTILNEGEEVVALKDIQKYSSYIFECKKVVKEDIIKTLNEKYGINIQNIKDPITYKSLLNTQVVILESIRRLTPKDSVLRPILKDFISILKESNGIEAVDVNDFINSVFAMSDYRLMSESVMTRYLNFAEIANDLGSVAQVLQSIQGGMGGQQNPAMGAPAPAAPAQQPQMPKAPMASPMQPAQQPPMGAGMSGDASEDDLDSVGMTPEDDEAGMTPDMGGGMEQNAPPVEMGGGQLMASLAELEELIQGLKVKLGDDTDPMAGEMDGGEEGFAPEMEGEGEEEFPDEEGESEDGDISIDTGDGDDEVHVDDIDDDAEHTEEEEAPDEKPKGKKSFPPKKEGKDKRPMPKKGKE
jgi:hypothetical protein